MTFLTLDDKEECIGYYCDGKLIFGEKPPTNENKTWKYSPQHSGDQMLYASLFCAGKDFDEMCPERLQETWIKLNSLAKAYIRSFLEAKVSLKENCFYDLVPKQFLIDYCDIKCQIIDDVLDTCEKPNNYDFLLDLDKLIHQIRRTKMNLKFDVLKKEQHDQKTRDFVQKYINKESSIVYNQFSSKTGRLTTEENSFPILNLSKQYRKVIHPKNDFFLELDYNAAEVRVFLALSGFKQPETDIHEWNRIKFGYDDRSEAKNNIISWLYGKKNKKEQDFKKYYNTELIKSKYWDGNLVTNHYGRKIAADDFHCVNYIVQSTAADLALRQAIEVNKVLNGCQSKISMIIHDSILIDMKKEEKEKINSIIDTYSKTEFGKFLCSVKVGKNFGEMKKIL